MAIDTVQSDIIQKCQGSVVFFLRNFCKTKHPSAGIVPFHPFKYQVKALRAFRNHRFSIFRKCRQCFTGDNMVWGPDGPKRIDEIKPGDLVYSYDFKVGMLVSVPVLEVFDNGEREVCEIKTKSGHKSRATLDHRYFLADGTEAEVASLNKSDRLLEVHDIERYDNDIADSRAMILGYLIADGCYSGSNGRRAHFTNTTWAYLLDFQRRLTEAFGIRAKITPHARDENGHVCCNRIWCPVQVFEWLESLGIARQKAEQKRIPNCVFRWSNHSISIFLNRLFAADGWYSGGNCNEVGIGQESVEMLNQIRQLLSRFGIDAKVYSATQHTMSKLRVFGSTNFNMFVEKIGIYRKNPRKPLTKGFFFNRRKGEVKQVVTAGQKEKVYDISVPPYHNYVVNGAVVHNSGASTISGAFALWFSMFFTHKTVLIVSRTDDDAKAFLRENVSFLFKNLPPWMQEVWKPIKENEHEIVLPNGSHIRSLTSHPDVLRSNASSLNIIDEAAFIQDMSQMWAGGYSCMGVWHHVNVGGSIYEIGELGDIDGEQWQEHDLQVQSDDGLKQSTKFYVNGEADVNVIVTSLGYNLACTDNHQIKNTDYEWVYSKDVKLGQRVALKCYYESTSYFETKLVSNNVLLRQPFIEAKNKDIVNPQCCQCHQSTPINYRSYKRNVQNNDGLFICRSCATANTLSPDFSKPKILDERLAELVGYYVGDGSLSDSRPKRLRLCYDPQDQDIYDHFAKYADTLGLEHHHEDANGAEEFRICNAKFVEWFKLNGLNSKTCAQDAVVPKVILRAHQSIRAAFLRGLFEADGWASIYKNSYRPKAGQTCVGFSSSSEKLVDQVHYMLLDLGILARKSSGVGGYENSGIRYRLSLINKDHMIQFMSRVGMISKRKSINIEKKTGKKPEKYMIDENGIFYDDVVKISRDRCMTVDISVPDNNTYVANGFVSHNTLTHGGSVIVVSTTNGVGNWYWNTWVDAEANLNPFEPIMINWWDMDWRIEYRDALTNAVRSIAPTDGIRECKTAEEIQKYGPYWSPWLEEQWRGLQERGETWKFKQEVLAEFVGSGNTVLDPLVLAKIQLNLSDDYKRVVGNQPYIHPVKGEATFVNFDGGDRALEADEGLWVWHAPNEGKPAEYHNGVIINPAIPAHRYVGGVDLATGKGRDYNTIELFDIDTMEQVAEIMIRCIPRLFKFIVDYIGRWYNNALLVVERNNGGDAFIDDLRMELMYPNLWRKKIINDKPTTTAKKNRMKIAEYGFSTGQASKSQLNSALQNFFRADDEGIKVNSRRLLKQFQIYVRKKDRTGRDTMKTEAESGPGNFDDLVIAAGLAMIGLPDAVVTGSEGLMPFQPTQRLSYSDPVPQTQIEALSDAAKVKMGSDPMFLMPYTGLQELSKDDSIQAELARFTQQLGALPLASQMPTVTSRKHQFNLRK